MVIESLCEQWNTSAIGSSCVSSKIRMPNTMLSRRLSMEFGSWNIPMLSLMIQRFDQSHSLMTNRKRNNPCVNFLYVLIISYSFSYPLLGNCLLIINRQRNNEDPYNSNKYIQSDKLLFCCWASFNLANQHFKTIYLRWYYYKFK